MNDSIIRWIIGDAESDKDQIYSLGVACSEQDVEIALRERVADKTYADYYGVIAASHSIPVMDYEVRKFLAQIPRGGGVILDIGGCWGWHWRDLHRDRPDLVVVILDFVKSNLLHAKNLLGGRVNESVFLVHGDAIALDFPEASFDAVWTVQTFQHIPDFERAVSEANRVLKPGGLFSNYSLNVQPHLRLLYQLLHKAYVTEDWVPDNFWLARASKKQKSLIEEIFHGQVRERWSEILFSPELHLSFPGCLGSRFGRIDSRLSNDYGFLGWFARQRSFHCRKR